MSSATATKSPLLWRHRIVKKVVDPRDEVERIRNLFDDEMAATLAKKFSHLPTRDTKQSTKPAWATPKLRSVTRGAGPSSLAELLQADQNRLGCADHEKQDEWNSPKKSFGGKAVVAGSAKSNRETGGKDERANENAPKLQNQTNPTRKVQSSTVFTQQDSHNRSHMSNGNTDNENVDRKKSLEPDKSHTASEIRPGMAASVRSPFVVTSKKVGQQNEGISPRQHSAGETPKSPTRKTSSEHIVLSSPGNSNPNSPTKRERPVYWKEKTKKTDGNQASKHTEQQNSKETAKVETHDEQRLGQNTRQFDCINTKMQSVGQENNATHVGQRLGTNQHGGTNTKVQSVRQRENVATSVAQIADQRDEQRVKRPQDGVVRSTVINNNFANNDSVAMEGTKHGKTENSVYKREEKTLDVSQKNPAVSVNQKSRSQSWREKLQIQEPEPEPEASDVQAIPFVEDRIVQHPTMPLNREAMSDSAEVEKLRTELEKLKTEHESVVGMYKTTINKMKEEMEEMKMMNSLTPPQNTMTPPAAPAPPPLPCPLPPPAPGGNVAPPPPPPPPPPPGGVGCPPPPPPPGAAPPPPGSSIVRPRKACIKPGVEMRPLFWQRILINEVEQGSDRSAKSRNTVWGNMKEADFDIKEFQKLFGRKINKRKRANKRKSLHEDMVFDQPEGKQVIKVLENSRSQTIGIIMTSLNCQLDDVKDAIYKMDTNTIDMDGLKALYHIRPRPDEIEVITKEVQDHPEATLDKPEGFLIRLHKMDHFSERLECWLYKDRFTEAVHDVDRRLGAIGEANVHIRTDKEIHFVLSLVLALGNYMNGSTTRGQADGFQIGALMKLKDIKTQDNMMNLLQYIVQLYCKIREIKGPGAEYTLPDPYIVLAGSQSSFKELRENMAQAKITLATCKAKHEIVVREGEAALREPFDSYMNEFFNTADVELSRLSEKHETIADEFKKITDYFMFKGEQNEEVGPPLFYGIWGHFLEDFKNYWKAEVLQIAKKKFSKTEHLQQIKAVATQFLSRRGSSSKDGVLQAKAAVAAKKTSHKQ